MTQTPTYFSAWSTAELAWRLHREQGQGYPVSLCCLCGLEPSFSGPCAVCLQAEIERRERGER